MKVKQEQSETTPPQFRPWDVSSLVKKEEDNVVKSPVASPNTLTSPPVPPPPPASLYPYLGLYSQLLHSMPAPGFPPSSLPHAFNPLMMQAHLALAAHHNSVLATAYSGLSQPSMMDRLKSNRFSPYPATQHQPGNTSVSSESKSAFQSVIKQSSPPASPDTATTSLMIKTITPPCSSPDHSSTSSSPGDTGSDDIQHIQKMVNGLNGGHETKFGISHEVQRTLTKSQ